MGDEQEVAAVDGDRGRGGQLGFRPDGPWAGGGLGPEEGRPEGKGEELDLGPKGGRGEGCARCFELPGKNREKGREKER